MSRIFVIIVGSHEDLCDSGGSPFLVGRMFFIIVDSDEDLCDCGDCGDSGDSGGSPFLVGRQRSLISTAGRPTLYPKQCHWIRI